MVPVERKKKIEIDDKFRKLSRDNIKRNYYKSISPHTDNRTSGHKKQKIFKLNEETISLLKIMSVLEKKNQSEFVEKLIEDAARHYIDNNLI